MVRHLVTCLLRIERIVTQSAVKRRNCDPKRRNCESKRRNCDPKRRNCESKRM